MIAILIFITLTVSKKFTLVNKNISVHFDITQTDINTL